MNLIMPLDVDIVMYIFPVFLFDEGKGGGGGWL